MMKAPGCWGVIVTPLLVAGLGLLWMTEKNIGGGFWALAIVPFCLMALGWGTHRLTRKDKAPVPQRIKARH